MLSPTVFFAVVIGSIFAFQTFGQIDLLTQGGPLRKTTVLTYYIYTELRNVCVKLDPAKDAPVERREANSQAGWDREPGKETVGAQK